MTRSNWLPIDTAARGGVPIRVRYVKNGKRQIATNVVWHDGSWWAELTGVTDWQPQAHAYVVPDESVPTLE